VSNGKPSQKPVEICSKKEDFALHSQRNKKIKSNDKFEAASFPNE
jgi:hypothetical protein